MDLQCIDYITPNEDVSLQKFTGQLCFGVSLSPGRLKTWSAYLEIKSLFGCLQQRCKALLLFGKYWMGRLESVYYILLFATSIQWPKCSISRTLISDQMPLTIWEWLLLIFPQFPIEAIIAPYSKSLTRYCEKSPRFTVGERIEGRAEAVTLESSISEKRW